MNGIGPEDYTVDPEQQWTGTWNNRGDEPNEMGDSLPFVDFDFDHDGHGPGSVQLSRTGSNVCAIDGATRELKCFGDPYELGQLGGGCQVSRCHGMPSCPNCCCLGSQMSRVSLGTNQRAVQVAAGGYTTCVIVEDRLTLARGLKCFGRGGYLGLGHNDDRGDNGGEMGDALPFVDLGAGRHPVQIAAGHRHVCAVLDDGSVKCFGENGSFMASGQPYDATNSKIGDEPGEMGDDLPSVDLGEGRTAVQICANNDFSCVIDDLGGLRCWGKHPGRVSSYAPGSVNVGSDTGAVVQIACGAPTRITCAPSSPMAASSAGAVTARASSGSATRTSAGWGTRGIWETGSLTSTSGRVGRPFRLPQAPHTPAHCLTTWKSSAGA